MVYQEAAVVRRQGRTSYDFQEWPGSFVRADQLPIFGNLNLYLVLWVLFFELGLEFQEPSPKNKLPNSTVVQQMTVNKAERIPLKQAHKINFACQAVKSGQNRSFSTRVFNFSTLGFSNCQSWKLSGFSNQTGQKFPNTENRFPSNSVQKQKEATPPLKLSKTSGFRPKISMIQ